MMEFTAENIERLKLLADQNRLNIIYALHDNSLTVTEIEKITGKSHSTTSQQLKKMVEAKILVNRQDGTQKFFKLRDPHLINYLNYTSSYLSTMAEGLSNPFMEGKKNLLLGLDKSGKTSIMLSFLGKQNLLSFTNIKLKPTLGFKHQNQILADMEQIPEKSLKDVFYEMGGQIAYREEFLQNTTKILSGFDKIIFVIDIRDQERYLESIDYFKSIVHSLDKKKTPTQIDIYLHKFDPDIDPAKNEKFSREKLNQFLIKPLTTLIPVKYQYSVFKTTIFTIFEKSLLMRSFQSF